ncbi:MAG: hypothetical protein AMJ42_04915 [Deltaproteobacteria bacterium DG_8]|nr:MAG: hypothetical protein AMJ42_04915 [Deltaproteobacteria bacterium DG_8]
MAANTSLLQQSLGTTVRKTTTLNLKHTIMTTLGVIGSVLVFGAVVAGVGILSYAITKVALEPRDLDMG